jgi:uncharacterized protein (DUF1697 family)
MPRYVAFLRGVSPQNAKMPELKRCFEAAGFSEVRTLLSSGNVVFSTARATAPETLARRAEKAMAAQLDRSFGTAVRSTAYLQALLDADPFAPFSLPATAKRVLTFLRQPPATELALPITRGGASILARRGSEVLSAYVPGPEGPVFMALLERSFGKDITTRTLDTVRKCAQA